MNKALLLCLICVSFPLLGFDKKAAVLYSSLNQTSLDQLLAFYELYPDTPQGKKALESCWELLAGRPSQGALPITPLLSERGIEGIISLVNKQPDEECPHLSESQLAEIEKAGSRLSNRTLKGYYAKTEDAIQALATDEIDLARAVFISQADPGTIDLCKIRTYEALIDLMALQIRARLPSHAAPAQTIRAINTYLFEELGYRFPPHSKHVKDIDVYTFLPSVIDSRHGVCLGVSILYLSLAQRLNLPLEIITPPGHIYLRHRSGNAVINIETTARGVHIDSEDYLSIRCRTLQERTLKEVIGLAHMNNAGASLKEQNYAEALKRYQKAFPYLPSDPQLLALMGYCHLIGGQKEMGESLLRQALARTAQDPFEKNTLAEDYFAGKTDIEGIQAVFYTPDETRDSLLKKKNSLLDSLAKWPEFRDGWQNLSTTWLQLHRSKEALFALEKSHLLDPGDCSVEFYLSLLHASRFNYKKSWFHLKIAEELANQQQIPPRILKIARQQLAMACPE